jgi:hypothetical protein
MPRSSQDTSYLSSIPEHFRSSARHRDSEDTLTAHSESEDTLVDYPVMANNANEEVDLQRKRSFGIGGAGNISRCAPSVKC